MYCVCLAGSSANDGGSAGNGTGGNSVGGGGGGSGGGSGRDRDAGKQHTRRRTQRRVTHSEKRYHSGSPHVVVSTFSYAFTSRCRAVNNIQLIVVVINYLFYFCACWVA